MANTKSAKKSSKSRGLPKKRGNKGDFHGLRLEYLNSRLPIYHDNGNKASFSDFWAETFTGYWRRFPWTVPLTIDPPQAPHEEDEDISQLSAEELHQRATIMTTIESVSVLEFSILLVTNSSR